MSLCEKTGAGTGRTDGGVSNADRKSTLCDKTAAANRVAEREEEEAMTCTGGKNRQVDVEGEVGTASKKWQRKTSMEV